MGLGPIFRKFRGVSRGVWIFGDVISRPFITLLTDDDLYWCTLKSEGVAQTVFNVALIGEVEELHVVTEDNEGGGSRRDLSHIVDLQPLALVGGGLISHHSLAENVVEHTRGDTGGGLVVDVFDMLVDVVDSLTCFSRNVDYGCVCHIRQRSLDLFIELVDGAVVLFDAVPFVYNYY